MSFPRYESYKDSGVEWLGEVPAHWQSLAVWLIFELGRGRVISNEEIIDNPGDYPVYSSQTENDGVMGRIANFDFEGDYLTWTTDGANAGTVFRRRGKFNCTNVCGTLKSRSDLIILDYCVHALAISTASFVRQDINPKLMNNVMAKIRIPIPPVEEQKTIAYLLDRETAKIDALIAEQQRLIALLKEKRQAVISHAVTKGLTNLPGANLNAAPNGGPQGERRDSASSPDVPMKDSGIEWLGEVPAHWELKRLGVLSAAIQTGPFGSQLHSEDYIEDETPVINPSNIQEGQIIADWANTVGSEIVERLSQHKLLPGDIIFGRRGEMGRCAKVTVTESGWLCGTGCLNVRLNSLAVSEFVSIYLRTAYVRELLKLESVGSTMDNLNTQILSRIPVPVPPLDEQSKIAAFIDFETSKLDTLTAEAQRGIVLLKERRSALISAAVTGKIDVRGLAETLPESVTA